MLSLLSKHARQMLSKKKMQGSERMPPRSRSAFPAPEQEASAGSESPSRRDARAVPLLEREADGIGSANQVMCGLSNTLLAHVSVDTCLLFLFFFI